MGHVRENLLRALSFLNVDTVKAILYLGVQMSFNQQ
jgi:hypothetical protein